MAQIVETAVSIVTLRAWGGSVKIRLEPFGFCHLIFRYMWNFEWMFICVGVYYTYSVVHHCAIYGTFKCREVRAPNRRRNLRHDRRLPITHAPYPVRTLAGHYPQDQCIHLPSIDRTADLLQATLNPVLKLFPAVIQRIALRRAGCRGTGESA